MALIEERVWKQSLERQVVAEFSVVVCEPNQMTSATICTMVDAHPNLRVISACTNGVQALELVVRSPVAAVIMASETPGMSALDVIREIKSRRPLVPIALVTHDKDARQAARRLGLFGGVNRYHLAELEPMLVRLADCLLDPTKDRHDRRDGTDRRSRQVWTSVTRQRRLGDERRSDH